MAQHIVYPLDDRGAILGACIAAGTKPLPHKAVGRLGGPLQPIQNLNRGL
jgi:hypothetical protein